MTAAENNLLGDGISVDVDLLRAEWRKTVTEIFAEATLDVPEEGFMHSGGLMGRHTEHLGFLLADLQFLQRAYPGSTW